MGLRSANERAGGELFLQLSCNQGGETAYLGSALRGVGARTKRAS